MALSEQAFCGNTECHVMMWNPTKTLTELADDIQQVQLPDWLGGSSE